MVKSKNYSAVKSQKLHDTTALQLFVYLQNLGASVPQNIQVNTAIGLEPNFIHCAIFNDYKTQDTVNYSNMLSKENISQMAENA